MPRIDRSLIIAGTLVLAGCTSIDSPGPGRLGEAMLSFADGSPAGAARLEHDGRGLSLALNVYGMTPGTKGVHLHTIGKCEMPGFTSAGPHLNPQSRKHGSLAPGGPHLGDLPNLDIGQNGSGTLRMAIMGGHSASDAIFDADGTAIVVHANADDYRTDPSGNSGDRIACGVLKRVD